MKWTLSAGVVLSVIPMVVAFIVLLAYFVISSMVIGMGL